VKASGGTAVLRTVLLNTGSNVSLMAIKIALSLVMTPMIVHSLGNYNYGIWESINAVLGYMGLLDLGVLPASSRFAAMYRARGDSESLNRLLATASSFMLLIAALAALLLSVWALLGADSLAPPGVGARKYSVLLYIVALQTMFVFPGMIFESIMEGFQRYAVKNTFTMFSSIAGALSFIMLHDKVEPLLLLAGANAAGQAMKQVVFLWYIQHRLDLPVRLKFCNATRSMLKVIVGFGSKNFLIGIGNRIMTSTDRLVIAGMIGPEAVVFYTLPLALLQQLGTLRMTLTHAFMPAFADLNERGRMCDVRKIVLGSSRVVVGVVVLGVLGIITLGPHFIGVWIDQQFVSVASKLIPLMAVSAFIASLHPFSVRLLVATDQHGAVAKASPIAGIVNLVVTLVLVKSLGLIGVVVGTTVAEVGLNFYAMRKACSVIGVSTVSYLRIVLVPLVVPTSGGLVVYLACAHRFDLNDFAPIALAAVCMTVCYVLLFYMLSLGHDERMRIRSALARTLSRR
jgi:O-antigen/teichoic acid export membrane protein